MLAIAAGALAAAGWRLAGLAAPGGLERVLACAVVATAAAVAQALLLGLVGLGSNSLLLTAAALATWGTSRLLVPDRGEPVSRQVRRWLQDPGSRPVVAGALAGVLVGWSGWLGRTGRVGIDGVYYRLPEIVDWIHSGHPGSIVRVTFPYEVGNYPLTNEIALFWQMSIARSFAPLALWAPFTAGLMLMAGWVGMRHLDVPRRWAAAALAAVLTFPLGLQVLEGPESDIPALAWLVTGASLALAASRRPALLVPALVALALAVGTKTPTALPALVIVVMAIRHHRQSLRPLLPGLAAALGLSLAVGGVWYLRNLILHGAPLWPLSTFPFGGEKPPLVASFHSVLERPRQVFAGRLDDYAVAVAGAGLLVPASLLAAVLSRRREVTIAALTAAGATLVWAAGPSVSDIPALDVQTSQTRYLLPAFAAAALALALATRGTGIARLASVSALAAALLGNLAQIVIGDLPETPGPLVPLLAAGAGAGAGLVLQRLPALSRLAAPLPLALAGLTGGLLLSAGASGWTARYAGHSPFFDTALIRWLVAQPAFSAGGRTVAMSPEITGLAAGDRLANRVELIPRREPCATVDRRRAEGWVVTRDDEFARTLEGVTVGRCRLAPPWHAVGQYTVYSREGAVREPSQP